MPSQERWRPRAGEWIDVRPFLWGTIVATAVDQDAVYTVEYKRGTNDPAPQDLVAATTVTAGVTNELYASTLENISHVRLVHRHTGVAGTTTASILGK
ncbi:MAG: hypothetical protein GWN13_09370 [Phycisphaerae bacterium]|nr:hypothetical protein [Phycisphaerae bacterium]